MRIAVMILASYILALSFMPCSDNENGSNSIKDENVLADTSPYQHSGHQDQCAPFCSCSCCGQPCSISLVQDFSQINNSPIASSFLDFDSAFPAEIYFNIWQPPKSC